MKLRLVSHASIVVQTDDCCIWTDPWLFGKAFNDSWSLLGPVAWDESMLDEVDYLWISHEHPDHFHIPTLRSLPEAFKQRVTVLFQRNASNKMFEALQGLGFSQHLALPHRKQIVLGPSTSVYCYQALPMDSALGVKSGERCIVDVNDVELSTRDCEIIRGDLGSIDVVLNQFSLAGYAGLADRAGQLPEAAERVLDSVAANHADLGAIATIPIASFIYFCVDDNRYMNAFANTPEEVVSHMNAKGLRVDVLFPGDGYAVGQSHDSTAALARWREVYAGLEGLDFDAGKRESLEHVAGAFRRCAAVLAERYPGWFLRRLEPIVVRIPDLSTTIRFGLAEASWEVTDAEPLVEINSQPLALVFAQPFGMQTLGVSARLLVHDSSRNWRLHRILFSMFNAEVYLKPRYLFTAQNLRFVASHLKGGLNQIRHRLSLMR